MRYIKVFLLIKTSMTNLIFTKIVSNGGFHLHRPFGLNYLPFHTGILSSFLVQIINRHYLTAHPQGCQGCQKNQKDLRFHTVHYKKEKCSFCLYLFWVKVKDQKKKPEWKNLATELCKCAQHVWHSKWSVMDTCDRIY